MSASRPLLVDGDPLARRDYRLSPRASRLLLLTKLENVAAGWTADREPAEPQAARGTHFVTIAQKPLTPLSSWTPAEVAAKIIDVDTPGLVTQILSRLLYAKIRRPVFLLNDI